MFEKYPRDLLQRFMVKSEPIDEDEESEEIELNLGLSLGGRFGIDKKNTNKIIRSSSVASSFIRALDVTNPLVPAAAFPNLVRTASLPAETEDERRKRKELQSLKRMEAKRRRSEKQTQKCLGFSNPGKYDDKIGIKGGQISAATAASRTDGPVGVQPAGLDNWACAARPGLFGAAVDSLVKGKVFFLGGGSAGGSSGGGLHRTGSGQANMQGSVESQGGSSGISDFESRPIQGTSGVGEPISPISNISLQERTNQDSTISSSKRPELREIGTNAMGEMPCVFTKGDGPNGRRVDGILYKYGKGEEVRIMCVCHGTFLSPAEFVQHAGGGDVPHPLRHIVICPASNSFL